MVSPRSEYVALLEKATATQMPLSSITSDAPKMMAP